MKYTEDFTKNVQKKYPIFFLYWGKKSGYFCPQKNKKKIRILLITKNGEKYPQKNQKHIQDPFWGWGYIFRWT